MSWNFSTGLFLNLVLKSPRRLVRLSNAFDGHSILLFVLGLDTKHEIEGSKAWRNIKCFSRTELLHPSSMYDFVNIFISKVLCFKFEESKIDRDRQGYPDRRTFGH